MHKNDKNFFSSNNNKDYFEDNFFVQEQNHTPVRPDFVQTRRHLNDYDQNLLEETAYKGIPDATFRLEYEISKIEKELKEIGNKILAAKTIRNKEEQISLIEQKAYLEAYYDSLIKQYNESGISAKISDYMSFMFGNSNYKNAEKGFLNKFISNLPKAFKKISKIESSLHNLKNITKSTDELLNNNITAAEDYSKYSQLSKYIVKANSLQAEIENFIKNQK